MRAPDYSCLWSSICYFCLYLSINGYHEYLATHKQEKVGCMLVLILGVLMLDLVIEVVFLLVGC